MTKKIIIFTGAPSYTSITPESCTLGETDPLDSRHLRDDEGSEQVTLTHGPAWRLLPNSRTGLRTTHQIDSASAWEQSNFFTTASLLPQDDPSADASGDDPISHFCDHSLQHADHASSHDQSFGTTVTDTSSETRCLTDTSTLQLPSHLSDLEDIPSVKQIQARAPQTITINLIAGILSIAQPRTITTRWGTTLSLVEVLLGDETKSGFGVTFWLAGNGNYSQLVGRLRRQDVVLLQNVALHVFRNKVYGQSLRREMTKVSILWRKDGGGHYTNRALESPASPQLQKTRLVKNWILAVVGPDPRSTGARVQRAWDQPPDDSPSV